MESRNINSIYFILQPNPEFEKVFSLTNKMKYTVFRWLVKKRVRFKDKQELFQIAFWEWYYTLKKADLPPKLVMICISNAVNLYIAYNSQKGERRPTLYSKSTSITLTPYVTPTVNLNNMKLKLLNYELKIINVSKAPGQIETSEIKRAKLLKRGEYW